MIDLPVPMKDQLMFGPAETLADDMPAASYPSNTLVPKAELLDITGGWIERRAEVTGRVTVPVHHRMGEFDHLWVASQDEIDEFRAGFTSAPSIDAALQLGSGHCIDFHLPSGEFQRLAARVREVGRADGGGLGMATVLRNVRVFDGEGFTEARDVAIDGGLIADGAGPDAEVVDGAGGYLVPGLIDCHIHLAGPHTQELLVAAGVTTGLDMSSPAPLVNAMRGRAGVTDIRSRHDGDELAGERARAADEGHPRCAGGARRRRRGRRGRPSPGASRRAPTTSRS